ncbi:pyridoxamine 5'-phosphate oxidase family protein [Streptomyces kunmingensis]|uniref:Pyridoxamine 5'-phosphate oxidase family protein n=1 Tax=Streptomyces kunmingensis TaxID=68225 RepID=A0ABU6C7Z5_9ACTN|nr:pyridoxamine 5'-phosphate oxidase family protein [Streptomyces kunmingensis]MEB3960832.1 pyridoxamine 5'-phosphate oxidase family protein [Streptomyces kunmingensis]
MAIYHDGELAVQERAGSRHAAGTVAAIVRTDIPDAARLFLAAQPMIVIGAADSRGDLWASVLTGEAGFITVTGPSSLTVRAAPGPYDPLHAALAGTARVGVIAIDPGTRRRMRMNGTAHRTAENTLDIELQQVYANCPKYIQKREPRWQSATPGRPRHAGELTSEDMAFVHATDTFFVATADLEGNADASHRGGHPGFLTAVDPTHLRWPDYLGNSMFNTLGNLEVNPKAGLLLPDWATGTLLHLTGTATVDWDPDRAAALPGAQRVVDFTVERAVRVDHASPLRWSAPEFSRFNPPVSLEGSTA